MHIQILQIRPEGYEHAGVLNEFAEGVYHGLRRLGIAACYDAPPPENSRQILIGAHLLREPELAAVPRDAIVYNSEQVTAESPWFNGPYLGLLKSREVWDYSEQNARRLTELGVSAVKYVPLGYVPELFRIPFAVEDIDVLFYGSMNPRRRAVIEGLQARGLKVQALFGVYGEERDRAIARAKLVLNLHFYESKVFETVRVSYLLTNCKAVVAELGPETAIQADLRDAIRGVRYEELVDACVALAADEKARRELAARGHRLFSRHPAEVSLAAALGRPCPARRVAPGGELPSTLHLGSGKDFRADWFNIDIDAAWGPDAVVDIAARDLIGKSFATERHGEVTLDAGSFETIVANDVLEHVPDLVTAMSNCLELLCAGGLFRIAVPYDLSLGAWQDPTHIRAFNENSWLYYTDWHWYLGWQTMRFDLVSLEYQASAFGVELMKAGKPTPDVLRTPRAVDSMRVVLRKRYLQPSERREALARQPRRAH